MSQDINRVDTFLSTNSTFIKNVDVNLDKQTYISTLQFFTLLPEVFTYNYLDRVQHILEYSDLFDRITFSSELTSRVFVPYKIIPTIPINYKEDLDKDTYTYEEEYAAGTNPDDNTDYPVSFFNVLRYI